MTNVNENVASEEVKEAPAPRKPKQFLIMADEMGIALLGKLIPSLLYVEVEGLAMQNNPNHMLLVNPIKREAPKTEAIEGTKVVEETLE